MPIKSYSPEIIVHPVLKAANEDTEVNTHQEAWEVYMEAIVPKVTQWFPAIHSVIIGPGLGRDSFLAEQITPRIVRKAVESSM